MQASALLLAALLALSPGCLGRLDTFSTTQQVMVSPITPGGYYTNWSQTTFSQSIDPGKQVHLVGVTLSSSTGEFSWLSSFEGAADVDLTQVIVRKTSFADAGGTTSLDVVDTGNLRSLFPTGNSFRLYWYVVFAPTLAQAYPDGVTVTVTYTIEVD